MSTATLPGVAPGLDAGGDVQKYEPLSADFLARLPTATADDGPSYLGDGQPVVPDEAAWHGLHTGEQVMRFEHRARDVRARVGAICAMDAQNRVSVQKVLNFMLWDGPLDLVTERVGPNKVVVRERTPDDGARVGETSFDSAGRLTLSPAVRMALNITRGDRVQVVGLPADGLIYVMSEQDALLAMTGPTVAECAASLSTTPRSPAARATRVRKARY